MREMRDEACWSRRCRAILGNWVQSSSFRMFWAEGPAIWTRECAPLGLKVQVASLGFERVIPGIEIVIPGIYRSSTGIWRSLMSSSALDKGCSRPLFRLCLHCHTQSSSSTSCCWVVLDHGVSLEQEQQQQKRLIGLLMFVIGLIQWHIGITTTSRLVIPRRTKQRTRKAKNKRWSSGTTSSEVRIWGTNLYNY
jgi:hypothetical protein